MDNVTYITNWLFDHNSFLKNRDDQCKMLKILVFYVVVFEKLGQLCEDKMIKQGSSFDIISNDAIKNNESEKILKIVNVEYANLEYNDLKNENTYQMFFYKLKIEDGEISDEWLSVFQDTYEFLMKKYQNYDFDKYVYKVHHKVFYSKEELNEEEIKQLEKIPYDDEQLLWEVFHDEKGNMYYW